MTLRSKIFIILASVLLIYGAVDFSIQRFIIFPGFQSLENDQAMKDSKRAILAIQREVHHLNLFCSDWAAWDDTYDFVESPSQEYIDANLVISVFTGNRLNLIYFFDTKGNVVWGQIHDINTKETIKLDDFSNKALPLDHPLINFKIENTSMSEISITGIFMTEQGPMLVASRPIINSNFEGPIRGTIVLGRFLDESTVNTLKNQTEVDFTVYPAQPDKLTLEKNTILSRITDKSKPLVEHKDKKFLSVYTTLSDILGNPAILIESKVPRDITQKGISTIRYAMYSIFFAALIVVILVMLLLQWIVLSPLTKLTDHALCVARTGDLTRRLSMGRPDEIGILSGEFDMMLEQLSVARNKFIEQSYYSGLGEMAGELMHNVRNNLTPMVGQISFIKRKMDDLPLKNMAQTISELDEGILDNKRKESLVRYLVLGSKQMLAFTEQTNDRLNNVSNSIVQIENRLAGQEKLSHSEKVIEPLNLTDILENALKKVPAGYQEKIKIHNNLSDLPRLKAERVVLIQVFANLLNIGFESILKTENNNGQIDVSSMIEETTEGIRVAHVIIKDNGHGLSEKELEHVFEQRFSKKTNASGFGLHWCANVISAMNGKMYAESPGIGQGSCFHILIPIQTEP